MTLPMMPTTLRAASGEIILLDRRWGTHKADRGGGPRALVGRRSGRREQERLGSGISLGTERRPDACLYRRGGDEGLAADRSIYST